MRAELSWNLARGRSTGGQIQGACCYCSVQFLHGIHRYELIVYKEPVPDANQRPPGTIDAGPIGGARSDGAAAFLTGNGSTDKDLQVETSKIGRFFYRSRCSLCGLFTAVAKRPVCFARILRQTKHLRPPRICAAWPFICLRWECRSAALVWTPSKEGNNESDPQLQPVLGSSGVGICPFALGLFPAGTIAGTNATSGAQAPAGRVGARCFFSRTNSHEGTKVAWQYWRIQHAYHHGKDLRIAEQLSR